MKEENNLIRILMVDDHRILLDGLKTLIEKEQNIELIGSFDNDKDAMNALNEVNGNIDVAVLDVSMHDDNLAGLKLCEKIKKLYPNIKVLILTMHDQQRYITPLVKAGADGYILKGKGADELLEAIEALAVGENYYGKAIVKTVMDTLANRVETEFGKVKLTSREIDVLKLLGMGYSSREVAERLFIEKCRNAQKSHQGETRLEECERNHHLCPGKRLY